ncbi:MAG TPA: Sir2 family NAD-dependent protein deacetylase [Planctomycetaceae bacterium]|jgi:NAD-dependent SIR2 family protein deacetylase|nr:Sir2 family NAD-dependent protein deacetylase [Planctomycetaceae bacterium]
MDTDNWSLAVSALRKAKHVVVFSGGGHVGRERHPDVPRRRRLWQRFPPEEFATWSGLWKTALIDPHSVADFVLNVVDPIARAEANPGHRAVAALGRRAKTTVVTQNVDGLHQTVGSTDVGPADRVKYINKNVEEGPPTRVYVLKPAYERFANDPNPEVAAAAKDALSRAPRTLTKEEFEKLKPQ